MEDFKKINRYFFLESKDNIIKLLNGKLSDVDNNFYLALSDTLLYFLEKNSLIYLKEEDKDDLKVFKKCNKFLYDLQNNSINNGLTYIATLFCIGYIKTYCYIFIKKHDKKNLILMILLK